MIIYAAFLTGYGSSLGYRPVPDEVVANGRAASSPNADAWQITMVIIIYPNLLCCAVGQTIYAGNPFALRYPQTPGRL